MRTFITLFIKYCYSDQAEWSYCGSCDMYEGYKKQDTQCACNV